MSLQFEQPRDHQKLSEKVGQHIEKAIMTGEIKVDDRLPTEAELSRSFEVSRTVIREAIQYLKAQGFVRSVAGSGSYVDAYRLDKLQKVIERFGRLNAEKEIFLNLLDLRLVIEVETTKRFAAKQHTRAIEKLRSLIVTMKTNEHDLETFARADMEFHLTIAEESGNPLFKAILESLKTLGVDYGLKTYVSDAVMEEVHEEHEAIYETIAKGDTLGAQQEMRAHISASRERYLNLIEPVDSN